MGWLILLLGIGLGVLWIIALATGGVAGWFLWISFGIAVALIALSIAEMVRVPRTRRPI